MVASELGNSSVTNVMAAIAVRSSGTFGSRISFRCYARHANGSAAVGKRAHHGKPRFRDALRARAGRAHDSDRVQGEINALPCLAIAMCVEFVVLFSTGVLSTVGVGQHLEVRGRKQLSLPFFARRSS